ncbi:MAG: DUF1805 domain-containing protein [Phycisphaerales bacterium]|nr:MAG: DUF1805 domain-containing protein [Phycisphaerales bacterium]
MDREGLKRTRHDLKRPLLVISGSKGVLACSYLNIATLTALGEAGATVRGVGNFEAMLEAEIVEVSPTATQLGVQVGMTGRAALEVSR